ncbi:hypothetical protein RS030_273695 [Cryptosporidium xiaoi]|uniref:Uncharacterized protein n=1 Tax=Cryptosporidium xiaoi TaxID=659607 RepID=A0AAV9XW28_9CRYT
MTRKRRTDWDDDSDETEGSLNIEEWKKDFFKDSGETQINGGSFEKDQNYARKEELELLEMMDPDAFDRVPMIYEEKDPEFIEENWKETRQYLTQDYVKKSKLANRKLKNRAFS